MIVHATTPKAMVITTAVLLPILLLAFNINDGPQSVIVGAYHNTHRINIRPLNERHWQQPQRFIATDVTTGTLRSFTNLKQWKLSFGLIQLYNSFRSNIDDDDDDRKRRQKQQQEINCITISRAILLYQQKVLDTFSSTAAIPTPSSQLRTKMPTKFISLQFRSDGYVELPTTINIATSRSNIKPAAASEQQPSSSMIRCLALQSFADNDFNDITTKNERKSQPALLIPLLESTDWWLLLQQKTSESSSKQTFRTKFDLRRQNSIIINHPSSGLYDNLPYHWYNNCSQQQPSSSSTSLGGKRECYDILLGKDWYLWNTKLVSPSPTNDSDDAVPDATTTKSLQSRMVQLQQQELESQLAECDSEIAYLLQQQRNKEYGSTTESLSTSSSAFDNEKDLTYWQQQRDILVRVLVNVTVKHKKRDNDELLIPSPFTELTNTVIATVQRFFNGFVGVDGNVPVPTPRSTNTSVLRTVVPYQNTYDMIRKRIIQDMLNADVIGILLENTSLLDVGSGMTLGGLIMLQKKPKIVQLLGETISVSSNDSDDLFFVECHVDEAIGMSLACGLPLWIAEESWKCGTVMCTCNLYQRESDTDRNVQPPSLWYTDDPELMVLVEGQSLNVSRRERVLPIRIPRISNLFDSMTMVEQQISQTSLGSPKDLFPTDNIIQSLQQYDQMSIDVKARTFMAMSNTQQIPLPRRRVVERSPEIIDEMLIPYIDESVRYEYKLRTAQRSGDTSTLQELEQQQSLRSKARFNSKNAEATNDDSSKEYWDQETEFYSSLRADVSQDVGSYSKFLDRDEWYERDRQRMVKRMLDSQKNENEML